MSNRFVICIVAIVETIVVTGCGGEVPSTQHISNDVGQSSLQAVQDCKLIEPNPPMTPSAPSQERAIEKSRDASPANCKLPGSWQSGKFVYLDGASGEMADVALMSKHLLGVRNLLETPPQEINLRAFDKSEALGVFWIGSVPVELHFNYLVALNADGKQCAAWSSDAVIKACDHLISVRLNSKEVMTALEYLTPEKK